MMASFEEVDLFLKQIREKLEFHSIGIVFRPREKNLDTLALLDIVPAYRNEIIKMLKPANYMSGPKNNSHDTMQPDYYEFGYI